MDDTLTLGRFIRESRLKRGMSLGQLAESVGRSSSSVRRWERDEVAPAITIMPVLAEALGVEVGELETRRPTVWDPDDTGTHANGHEASGSTIEQAAVPVIAQPDPGSETGSQQAARQLGVFGDLWNTMFANKPQWIGWVRGGLTAILLILMVVILFWALGELLDGLKAVWDSFGTGG